MQITPVVRATCPNPVISEYNLDRGQILQAVRSVDQDRADNKQRAMAYIFALWPVGDHERGPLLQMAEEYRDSALTHSFYLLSLVRLALHPLPNQVSGNENDHSLDMVSFLQDRVNKAALEWYQWYYELAALSCLEAEFNRERMRLNEEALFDFEAIIEEFEHRFSLLRNTLTKAIAGEEKAARACANACMMETMFGSTSEVLSQAELDSFECSICREVKERRPDYLVLSLPCAHLFHWDCVTTWIIHAPVPNCPLCRQPLLT